jgi:hypothetical protein
MTCPKAALLKDALRPAARLFLAAAALALAPSAAAVAISRTLLARLARRRILRPLDQLLRLDERAVLVLGD